MGEVPLYPSSGAVGFDPKQVPVRSWGPTVDSTAAFGYTPQVVYLYVVPWLEFPMVSSYPYIRSAMVKVPHHPLLTALSTQVAEESDSTPSRSY